MTIPEIVAPGGSMNKAIVAAKYGADAVYLGVPFTSLRMRQNKINTLDDLSQTIEALHKLGKSAYLTMNIFPKNIDIKIFETMVEKISGLNADAIIFSDPGTFNIIKKHLPNMKLHLSTQSSTLNYEAVKFWSDLGVSRVVLGRELHISEIAEIKKNVPEMELEIFVHGAMCMSYSGRCLLGEFFSARDGNKGECSHVCRFKYKAYIEEQKRPGKFYQVGENEDGSFILSSKDLCTIQRLQEIIPYVDGLKIEGRSKSEFYVGATSKAYSHVRDAITNQTPINENIQNLVNEIPHRTYWDGFVLNGKGVVEEETLTGTMTIDTAGPISPNKYYGIILDEFVEIDNKKYFKFIPKQDILLGQTLKYISPQNIGTLQITDMLDESQKSVERLNCNMNFAYIGADKTLDGYEILFG